ncbi:MAG TPA: amidohydrolase [Armatimonadota bacterium]|nr:amidohydrolase [Armatimonadota bacterium]
MLISDLQISPPVMRLRDRLVAVRRDLHQHPEPGFHEVRTAAMAANRLKDLGYQVRAGVAETGVVVDTGRGRGSRTLMLRFDMDALPIMEATGAPYASNTPGWMHACGHDGHTSMGLALAELLQLDPLPGTVKLIFQPAEESLGGASRMIEEGVLADPDVDACLGMHLWNELPVGVIGVRPGPVMASIARFDVIIHGRGGHNSAPQLAADALVAAAHIVVALQTIVSRGVPPAVPAVLSVGEFHSGTANNVIAEDAVLRGTLRTFDETVQEAMIERVRQISMATARAHGTTAEVVIDPGYPTVVNDETMCEIVRSAAVEVVGRDRVIAPLPSMGGEDMAFFLQRKPGCFFFVGSANRERNLTYAHHNPRFDFDEDAMLIGVEVMLRATRRYFAT